MTINESITMSTLVTVKKNELVTPVLQLKAQFDTSTMNVSYAYITLNKSLIETYQTDVQAQVDEFKAAVSTRATELGYLISF